jgi:hypothetical protein
MISASQHLLKIDSEFQIFYLCNDAPLTTANELDIFCSRILESQCDMGVAVSKVIADKNNKDLVSLYKRTMLPFSDGPYLLGNMFYLNSKALSEVSLLQDIFLLRKQSRLSTLLRSFMYLIANHNNSRKLLAVWLRFLMTKIVWSFSSMDQGMPAIAPSFSYLTRCINMFYDGKLTVDFVNIGCEGSCWDVDNTEQLCAVSRIIEKHESVLEPKEAVAYA